MGIEDDVEKWLFGVAVKKGVAALVGYLVGWAVAFVAGSQMAHLLAVLQAIGVTVTVSIDRSVFEPRVAGLGLIAFTMAHDWLKLRLPSAKWL